MGTHGRAACAALCYGVVLPLLAVSAAHSQEEETKLGWAKSAEFSLVSTSGNSETDTLGLAAAFVRTMEDASLTLTANGLRAESTTTARRAVGTSPDDFVVDETSSTELTAENYAWGARYDRQLSDRVFWYAGLTWERNEFAGFSERVVGLGGLGHLWWEDESSHFKTDYGVTYTSQDDLVPAPGLDDAFLGLRLSYDYGRSLGRATRFGSTLVFNQNLAESEDWRADFLNSLAVSMSEKLALKVGVKMLYDNLPALGVLPLEFADGTPTGDVATFVLDDLDTVVTTALVVTF